MRRLHFPRERREKEAGTKAPAEGTDRTCTWVTSAGVAYGLQPQGLIPPLLSSWWPAQCTWSLRLRRRRRLCPCDMFRETATICQGVTDLQAMTDTSPERAGTTAERCKRWGAKASSGDVQCILWGEACGGQARVRREASRRSSSTRPGLLLSNHCTCSNASEINWLLITLFGLWPMFMTKTSWGAVKMLETYGVDGHVCDCAADDA